MRYAVKPIYKPFLFLLDLVGNLLFFWTKLFSVPENPKSILVIRLDHAGDMVMTLPVFASLKKCFPNSKIFVLCRSFLKDFVEADNNVDGVISLDVPWFSRESSAGWFKTIKFLLSLRKKFDVVIELHSDPRNIFIAFLIGGFRIGYAVRGFGFLLNRIVEFPSKPVHMIQQNLRVVESIGCSVNLKVATPGFALSSTTERSRFAQATFKSTWKNTNAQVFIHRFLNTAAFDRAFFQVNRNVSLPNLTVSENKIKRKLSVHHIKKYIIVHPSAARSEKLWLNDRWASVIDKIINLHRVHVLITGASVEFSIGEDIINQVSGENLKYVLNACRLSDNLLDLASVVKNSLLVISVDTVTVHLAHALKVPVVALYGPTDPVVWGYDDKKAAVVYKKLSDGCSFDCRKESHRMKMMGEISVDDVMSVVEKFL